MVMERWCLSGEARRGVWTAHVLCDGGTWRTWRPCVGRRILWDRVPNIAAAIYIAAVIYSRQGHGARVPGGGYFGIGDSVQDRFVTRL